MPLGPFGRREPSTRGRSVLPDATCTGLMLESTHRLYFFQKHGTDLLVRTRVTHAWRRPCCDGPLTCSGCRDSSAPTPTPASTCSGCRGTSAPTPTPASASTSTSGLRAPRRRNGRASQASASKLLNDLVAHGALLKVEAPTLLLLLQLAAAWHALRCGDRGQVIVRHSVVHADVMEKDDGEEEDGHVLELALQATPKDAPASLDDTKGALDGLAREGLEVVVVVLGRARRRPLDRAKHADAVDVRVVADEVVAKNGEDGEQHIRERREVERLVVVDAARCLGQRRREEVSGW